MSFDFEPVKKEFEERWRDPMTEKYGKGFALYCSFCDGTWRDEILSFLETATNSAYEQGVNDTLNSLSKMVWTTGKARGEK